MALPPALSPRPPADPKQAARPPGAIQADLLFRDCQEILIAHHGETYRLRITRNGKLILTK